MAWLCGKCRQTATGDAACEHCGAPRIASALEARRRRLEGETPGARDLAMEAHLGAIALWLRVSAGALGALIVLGTVALALLPRVDVHRHDTYYVADGGGVAGLLGAGALGLIALLSYLAGHHLARRSNAARIALGVGRAVAAVASLALVLQIADGGPRGRLGPGFALLVLASLAFDGAQLWALFSPRAAFVCSRDYDARITAAPDARVPRFATPFFWAPLVLALVAAALVIAAALYA